MSAPVPNGHQPKLEINVGGISQQLMGKPM